MSKVRKIIDSVYTATTFIVGGIGIFGAAALGSLFNAARNGFQCLPSPPVNLDIAVSFDASHFDYMKFVGDVTAHKPGISLPIGVQDTISFAGTGTCADEIVRATLNVAVPVVMAYATVCIAKGISDYTKPENNHLNFQALYNINDGGSSEEVEKARCC